VQIIWLTLGILSFGLGAVGAFVPLLPTVPLVLLAAYCFAKSSDRLHTWLLQHPRFGAPIRQWQESGAINSRAKYLASISIILTFSVSLALGLRTSLLIVQAAVLCLVLLFIWTRPNA